MPDPLAARQLLRKYGIRARKSLGQNFIIDRRALDDILQAAELSGSEHVVEVGAGLGALTLRLSTAAARVIAIELDDRLMGVLRDVLSGTNNVDVIIGDVLATEINVPRNYHVVANIPYNITSALIRHYLERGDSPSRMVFTVQTEVAQRASAGPGQMSLLALSVQIYGIPEVRGRIPPSSFYPEPDIESAILRIDMHRSPVVAPEWITPIFRLARAGFSQRRKMLRNSLGPVLGKRAEEVLVEARIGVSARAQELSVGDWEALARASENALG